MRPCSRELLVAVHDISKSYGRRTAVAGVTLTLWAGEICGFVGANGAGKTTALRMLAGILKPDGGSGHILGFGLQRDAAEIRQRIGYMSQRLSLYAELSVFENLRFRAAVYGRRNPRAAAEAAMGDFNLLRWAHSPAASLSGGWARRLQLAASLLHAPQLVLLDEPTAGLDAVARQDVWRRIEGLAAAGAGVIVCTHDLAEAERCSHAAFFATGRGRGHAGGDCGRLGHRGVPVVRQRCAAARQRRGRSRRRRHQLSAGCVSARRRRSARGA